MIKKLITIILTTFIILSFIPKLNAEEDYSTYEIIEVNELPTAGEEYTNKLYKYNDKYYISKLQEVIYTPIELGDNLTGQTIYFNFPDNLRKSHTYARYIISTNTNYYTISDSYSSSIGYYIGVLGSYYYHYKDGVIKNETSFTFPTTADYTVTGINSATSDILQYISKTPFEESYTWIEVDYDPNLITFEDNIELYILIGIFILLSTMYLTHLLEMIITNKAKEAK